MTKPLIEAVGEFLGPIMAQYAATVEYSRPETEVTILFGDEVYRTTMAAFQQLDAAHAEAFDRNSRAICARRNRKVVGALL
jgi:hypothetical protein